MKNLQISVILIVILSACNRSSTDKSELMESSLSNPDSTLFQSLVSQYNHVWYTIRRQGRHHTIKIKIIL